MSGKAKTSDQRSALEKLAKSLVEVCVRNAMEHLHAGIYPSSRSGDYSDVKVVTPYCEILWTQLSRISDEEIKGLMIDVVNKTYTFLRYMEDLAAESGQTRHWNRPKLDRDLMIGVRRRRAARGVLTTRRMKPKAR